LKLSSAKFTGVSKITNKAVLKKLKKAVYGITQDLLYTK
jgi:hypothetical protein